MVRAVLIFLLTVLVAPGPALAQDFGAFARILPEESDLSGNNRVARLELGLSQAVPFRVFTLTDPARVVLDLRQVEFGALDPGFNRARPVSEIAWGGATEPGWSRLVLTLDRPMLPSIAAMQTDDTTGAAQITLELRAADAERFEEAAGPPAGQDRSLRPVTIPASARDDAPAPLRIMLDPGHGGVDPGAIREGFSEATLILAFARELRDVMRRTGQIEIEMTRDSDVFVPLPTRVSLARAADVDLFLSLHADAIAEGSARGATVYTLAETASDEATAQLAAQHDRADLLQGIDLSGSDDEVASVLMDLARLETAPRSLAAAEVLVRAIDQSGLDLHSTPFGEGAFSVLRAPDIPAVLLEIGYLSEGGDLENILDPEWRARMQLAITAAVLAWAEQDAALEQLRRN